MKESTIINIISTIYSKIAFFFWFIIFSIILIFGILLYGIKIDHLQTKELSIEKLYIKWDEKLLISADKIEIFKQNKQNQNQLIHQRKPFKIASFVKLLSISYNLFQYIDLKKISYKDIRTSILYTKDKKGYISLDSAYTHLKGDLYLNQKSLHVKVNSLKYLPLKVQAKGDILFEKSNKLLTTNFDINLTNQAFFHLKTTLKDHTLNYSANFQKPIKDTAKILKLLHLPKPVQYWAITAINTKKLIIKQLHGTLDLNNPQKALKQIYVSAIADKLKYTYNPKLSPIETQYTFLEFKRGVLYIHPNKPKTYGYDLEKSYLKIDFTHKPEELLTLYLRFNKGKLDKNIINILATYGIDVPLVQTQGTTRTNLTISVSLRNINVNAKGKFYVKKGKFLYLGMNIAVKDVLVNLDNSHITVKNMVASLENSISTFVDIDLRLSKHTGQIDFHINKLQLPSYHTALIINKKYPTISYIINQQGSDTIKIPQTSWKLANKTVFIDPLNLNFDFATYTMKIPLSKISLKENALGYISGKLDLKQDRYNINIDIIKYKEKNVTLAQSNLNINIKKEQKSIKISSNPIHLYLDSHDLYLSDISLKIDDTSIKSNKINIRFDNIFHSRLQINQDLQTNQGSVTLLNSQYNINNIGILFMNTTPLSFKYSLENGFKILSSKLNAVARYNNNETYLKLTSLKRLLPYSPLLQKYKITQGYLHYSSDKGFYSEFRSLYKLIRIHEKAIHNYKVKITPDHKEKLSINNHIFVDFSKGINVTSNDIGIDIDQMQKIIKIMDKSKTKNSSSNVFINLNNGYLYISKSRRILYEKLNIQSIDNILTAQLFYKNGKAGFRYHQDHFYLYGSNFNDTFMSNLFLQSKFKNGNLNFNIVGSFDDYKGIFEITKTTVLDYKLLTNILAFIDTVPSLVTFSLPKYSKEGLLIHKAYASFEYQKGIFTFDNVHLDSDQIDIVGAGTASYIQDNINFVFQLKTNIASKASKIPLVGYLLFDGKTISTTLKIDGKLTDPKVSTLIAQSIIVAPINILKRTILLPAHLLGLDKPEKEKKKKK